MGLAKEKEANFLRFRGKSMWPVFQEGDLLEVQPVDMQTLRIGDCITYRTQGDKSLTTHRVIAIHDNNILTRGDAHPEPDDLSVNINQVIGRVIGRFRMGRRKSVWGGLKGRLAGRLYHYAGRFDPQRAARGGYAALRLRSSLQWLAASVYRRGELQTFGENGEASKLYWLVDRHPWATFDQEQERWMIPWPQSLLIDPEKLPHKKVVEAA